MAPPNGWFGDAAEATGNGDGSSSASQLIAPADRDVRFESKQTLSDSWPHD